MLLQFTYLSGRTFSGHTDKQVSPHYIMKLANLSSSCLRVTEAGLCLECWFFASAFFAANSQVSVKIANDLHRVSLHISTENFTRHSGVGFVMRLAKQYAGGSNGADLFEALVIRRVSQLPSWLVTCVV
jgi:hypothetical protein